MKNILSKDKVKHFLPQYQKCRAQIFISWCAQASVISHFTGVSDVVYQISFCSERHPINTCYPLRRPCRWGEESSGGLPGAQIRRFFFQYGKPGPGAGNYQIGGISDKKPPLFGSHLLLGTLSSVSGLGRRLHRCTVIKDGVRPCSGPFSGSTLRRKQNAPRESDLWKFRAGTGVVCCPGKHETIFMKLVNVLACLRSGVFCQNGDSVSV